MSDNDDLPAEEQEISEAEVDSDEEEERGSSAEEGSNDAEDDDDDDEEGSTDGSDGNEDSDGSPTARRRPRKKTKPFVPPPPRSLPQRTTRGARMGDAVAEEGDEEFWNQEFFQEEANDERYETESEPEDRFDADFNESEVEEDDDVEAAQAEAELKAKEGKKKVLKPPGHKKPPLPKPRPKAGEDSGGKAAKPKRSSIGPEDFSVGRRTVRESTRIKVEEAEMERKLAEKYKPRRAPQRSSNFRPLTQAELLAEAAKTEIENTKSLQYLVAVEEETKKKAAVQKRRYAGPMLRWKSRRVGDAEMTTLEVRNMAMPDELRHRTAPPPPPPLPCAITGLPARYRDPATGLPYANLEAYKELKRRREAGLLPLAGLQAAAGQPHQQLPGTAQELQQSQVPSPGMQLRTGQGEAAVQQQFVQATQPLYQPQLLQQQQQQQQQFLLPQQQQQQFFQQHQGFVPQAAGMPGIT